MAAGKHCSLNRSLPCCLIFSMLAIGAEEQALANPYTIERERLLSIVAAGLGTLSMLGRSTSRKLTVLESCCS